MKIGCVIMAAGASTRFGSNKLLTLLQGRPLYTYALNAVSGSGISSVTVVTACPPIAETAKAFGFQVVENNRPELGISHTIHLGLNTLSHCDGVLFMTADQPFLSSGTLQALSEAFRQQPDRIVAASSNGQRGNPCLFPACLFPELLALSGDTGGGAVIRRHADLLTLVEVPAQELADADTPEALETLKKQAPLVF